MFERYARQMVLPEIGPAGQERLAKAKVAIIGCGALGSAAGEILARAGVGHLVLIDRDVVELSNLQRQLLYTEADASLALPKAEAMEQHLREINSSIQVTPWTVDLNYRNAIQLLAGAQLLIDATDNYLARLLINDAALELGVPWVYGGALGTVGMAMPIIPGKTPCFRCLVPELPAAGQLDTCDLVGVLGGVTVAVAAIQASLALRMLVNSDNVSTDLIEFNLWTCSFRQLAIPEDPECPACKLGRRDYLQGSHSREAAVMCGRDTVQVWPLNDKAPDFASLGEKLTTLGVVQRSRYTLRFLPANSDFEITLFADGRAMIKGTFDPNQALSVYARYFG